MRYLQNMLDVLLGGLLSASVVASFFSTGTVDSWLFLLRTDFLLPFSQMDHVMLSALRRGHHNRRIHVRVSRLWYHRGGLENGEIKEIRMVLIDEQATSMYAIIPRSLVADYIGILNETTVHWLALFRVTDRPQILAPVDNPLVILFTELTIVHPILNAYEMFPEWTYSLTALEELPAPHDTPARLLDIVGVIRSISSVSTNELPERNISVARRSVILADNSGREININLWGEAAFRFNGQLIEYLGRDQSAVAVFVGMTLHSHAGSIELAGAASCRWYVNVDIPEINVLRAESVSLFMPIVQLPAPGQINLRAQVIGRYPTRRLSTLLNHDLFQNQDARFRCVVQVWRLTPGQPWWFAACTACRRSSTPVTLLGQSNGFQCSDIGCPCTTAALEYRLHILGSDNTGEAEFCLFGRIAREFVGVSAHRVILNNYQGDLPITDLVVAASQIQHTPPELAAVVSGSYKFFLYVRNSSFQGNWASFNVLAVEARYPAE